MCKISIVIPAYNAEGMIGRMLDSVCGQSFRDWEAIVVDDGSKDATAAILDQYAATDPRFKVIRQPNGGVSSARNVGMAQAKGHYIYFADADDTLEKDCLKLLYDAAVTVQADIVACGFRYVDSLGQTIEAWLPRKQESVQAYCSDWIRRYGINTLCNKLLVRSRIRHLFDTDHSLGEDLKFSCEYLGGARRIAIVERPLYIYYCKNEGSLTKNRALSMGSLMYDTNNLASLACAWQIPMCLVANRFFKRVLHILLACQSKPDLTGTLEALMCMEGLKEFSQAYKPGLLKYRFFRILLNNRGAGSLYAIAELKRLADGFIHGAKGRAHEK